MLRIQNAHSQGKFASEWCVIILNKSGFIKYLPGHFNRQDQMHVRAVTVPVDDVGPRYRDRLSWLKTGVFDLIPKKKRREKNSTCCKQAISNATNKPKRRPRCLSLWLLGMLVVSYSYELSYWYLMTGNDPHRDPTTTSQTPLLPG